MERTNEPHTHRNDSGQGVPTFERHQAGYDASILHNPEPSAQALRHPMPTHDAIASEARYFEPSAPDSGRPVHPVLNRILFALALGVVWMLLFAIISLPAFVCGVIVGIAVTIIYDRFSGDIMRHIKYGGPGDDGRAPCQADAAGAGPAHMQYAAHSGSAQGGAYAGGAASQAGAMHRGQAQGGGRQHGHSGVKPRYLWFAFELSLMFAWELLKANLAVLAAVFKPRMDIAPGIVVLPITLKSEARIMLLANMITLTPGTISVEIAPDNSAIYVHALDCSSAEGVAKSINDAFTRRLERFERIGK